MFQNHPFTKGKFNNHKQILNNCDIFIYQHMNKHYNGSEYNIQSVNKYLKNECKVIRINYYRTRAFWYECNYIPYNSYGKYSFHSLYGLFKDLINF
jgi:hypothetical protein